MSISVFRLGQNVVLARLLLQLTVISFSIRLETRMLTLLFLQDYLSGSCYHDSPPHDAV